MTAASSLSSLTQLRPGETASRVQSMRHPDRSAPGDRCLRRTNMSRERTHRPSGAGHSRHLSRSGHPHGPPGRRHGPGSGHPRRPATASPQPTGKPGRPRRTPPDASCNTSRPESRAVPKHSVLPPQKQRKTTLLQPLAPRDPRPHAQAEAADQSPNRSHAHPPTSMLDIRARTVLK